MRKEQAVKRIRIVCDDPDATDTSDDELEMVRPKRFVRELRVPFGAAAAASEITSEESVSRKRSIEPSKGKFRGVRMRKWGKWAAEIRDPFQHKRVWLGTYTTAEQASKAYESKRMEFQAMLSANGFSSDKSSKTAAAAASEVSSGSHTSPASVLEVDSSTSRKSDIEFPKPNYGLIDEELLAFSQIGEEIDLGMELNALVSGDFVPSIDDLDDVFDDLPICGDDQDGAALPDFDFDFDFEACSDALAWMDESPPAIMDGMNGTSLNIACP